MALPAASALIVLIIGVSVHDVVPSAAATTPIRHVVVIYQENHSYDNVLGRFCRQVAKRIIVREGSDQPCDGATTGRLPDESSIPLSRAADVVPGIGHSVADQTKAIDAGAMDAFSAISGCGPPNYKCYAQYSPSQIPNTTALASAFAVSDRTFESFTEPSWAAHMELVAATRDGFQGDNPHPLPGAAGGPGWGCDSNKVAMWRPSDNASLRTVPACVPTHNHDGAFEGTPVKWVPTIMDRLDEAGLNWKLYTVGRGGSGYGWAICPTFADCLYTPQHNRQVGNTSFFTEAADGALPSFSILLPDGPNSQHNGFSMAKGDDWIGRAVQAVENGPDWSSTAIFITWDDCGCFSDHVAPPPGLGIREPMIIVSPYARPGFTDSNVASFYSLLAFTEHTFGLSPLSPADADAYDYSQSFDYSQRPLPPVAMRRESISSAERTYIATHVAARHGET
jgi:phospholipase C